MTEDAHPTLYARLRSEIIMGKLAPGRKLRLETLRESYDVATSSLREALTRLASTLR